MATPTIFVPADTTARSLGADAVAAAVAAEAARRGADVRMVRNGSRGLYWLEPLVEVLVGELLTVDGLAASAVVCGVDERSAKSND